MSEQYVLNKPTHLTCPECGGALAKIDDGILPRYVCHIGHILTGEAMLEAQAERIEESLTTALAMLNERRELCRQMGDDDVADTTRLARISDEATQEAETIRDLLNGQAGRPTSI